MTAPALPNGALETEAPINFQEAIELVWLEAELLDGHNYLPWLALWTNTGKYVIPIDRDSSDFDQSLNIVNDDQAMREARVKRLRSGFSMSSAPPARTVRTISRFTRTESEQPQCKLRAAQHIIEYKYERTRTLAADVSYKIVRHAGVLKIDEKVVRLINSDDALHGIGYLL